MLTVTLRALERGGFNSRHACPVISPCVGYSLTSLGRSLLDIVEASQTGAPASTDDVEPVRASYDGNRRQLPAQR